MVAMHLVLSLAMSIRHLKREAYCGRSCLFFYFFWWEVLKVKFCWMFVFRKFCRPVVVTLIGRRSQNQ